MFLLHVDGLCSALDKGDTYRVEQFANGRDQPVRFRLVKTRAYAQLGLGGQHGHFDLVVAVNIQQPRCTQSGPHATEACANNQNLLFHFLSPDEKPEQSNPE